jgi:hypothetical protein
MKTSNKLNLREALKGYWRNLVALPFVAPISYYLLKYTNGNVVTIIMFFVVFFIVIYFAFVPFWRGRVKYTYLAFAISIYVFCGLILVTISELLLNLFK